MKIRRDWMLLLGSLLIVAALYNHYMGHSAYLVEIIFVAVGAAVGLYSVTGLEKKSSETEDGLLVAALSRFLTKEQCSVVIPATGFFTVLAWSAWKLLIRGSSDLQMDDFIVTLLGLSLILYHSAPSRFTMQKDFVVLYLMFMAIVFVVIWNLYTIITGDSYAAVTAYAEYYFITIPTVSLVRLLGFQVYTELDLSNQGLSNIIKFEYEGSTIWLGIGTGCSGLYAAGLFFSAFLAFVLVRYRKVDPWIILALGLGFLVTWASNIIRMVITIMVGSAYGPHALAFFHSYIGILTFVLFVTVFWMLIVRWLDRIETPKEPVSEAKKAASGEDQNAAA